MRARWLTLLVMMAGAAPALAEPDATCAAACQRLAQCKLASADACVAGCKRSGAEATPEGRERLVSAVRASCDQLAAASGAQPQPAPRATPGPQARSGPQVQPGPGPQPAPQAQPGSQAQPAPRTSPPPRTPPAQRAQLTPPAKPAAPESDRHVWRCTSEGSYEVLRKGEIYWRPAPSSAFGFGKTQQLAILMANDSCFKHMHGMMVFQNINNRTRIKTQCHPIQCTPPP